MAEGNPANDAAPPVVSAGPQTVVNTVNDIIAQVVLGVQTALLSTLNQFYLPGPDQNVDFVFKSPRPSFVPLTPTASKPKLSKNQRRRAQKRAKAVREEFEETGRLEEKKPCLAQVKKSGTPEEKKLSRRQRRNAERLERFLRKKEYERQEKEEKRMQDADKLTTN